ncbi:MAG: hypothetical protein FD145_742 [Candidatus Saganbacteria bacterium]|uniref:Polymerase beta nucleotidyltransferase domain-containing protein n=1 Tax=Candidatus Saganbacteria bacterium TaxID=2575572 RepID=A0A833NX51_UNCSA|nr:MAG: hypothetical protein FD145_742 [Candidatus Saganbacteria bacterium]
MKNKFNQEMIDELCGKHKVNLLVLHGSFVTGKTTPESDIDVGILGDAKYISKHHLDIISDFSRIFGDSFDPVFLNGAESMITYQVGMRGVPLYEGKKGDFTSFKTTAISRYMDAKKFRDLEKKYIQNAIREEAE